MPEINFSVSTDLAPISSTIIAANFEETEAQLRELISPYQHMIVTEDTVNTAKSDLARVRKVKASLDEYRKSIKKAFTAPVTEFEEKVKTLTGICKKAEDNLSGQIDGFAERVYAEKLTMLELYFKENSEKAEGMLTFEQTKNPKWKNTTFTLEAAKQEIKEAIDLCADGIEAIRALNSPFEAELLAEYAINHDLAGALKKNGQLAAIKAREDARKAEEQRRLEAIKRQREEDAARRAEEEAARAEEAEKHQEAEPPHPEMPAPPKKEKPDPAEKQETIYCIDFRVRATRAQLVALKEACGRIGLQIERI